MAGPERQYFVYIMTNKRNTVLYTGMTGNLRRRITQHKLGVGGRFTSRYHGTKLVYFEQQASSYAAIVREKKIKGGSRRAKIRLIERINPEWRDLGAELPVCEKSDCFVAEKRSSQS